MYNSKFFSDISMSQKLKRFFTVIIVLNIIIMSFSSLVKYNHWKQTRPCGVKSFVFIIGWCLISVSFTNLVHSCYYILLYTKNVFQHVTNQHCSLFIDTYSDNLKTIVRFTFALCSSFCIFI